MARINRSDVIQKAVNDLAISTSTDKVPNETLDKVQLTYDLNRKFTSFIVSSTATLTSGTLTQALPIVSDRSETYITQIHFGMIKDAACDVNPGNITLLVTPAESNIPTGIIRIPILTLTAQSENVVMNFAYPLKVKSNSSLTSVNTYTLGLMSRALTISGFTTSTN